MTDGRMLLRLSDRRLVSLPLLALAAGCVASTPATLPELSGTLLGESMHFRLFVDPGFDTSSLPAYLQGNGGLDALEADWADKQTMLKMPEGQPKIDYHLMTREHIVAACGEDADACELGPTLQIADDSLPFQHELIHAYMAIVAPGAEPGSFIREGTAQAIGCYGLWFGGPATGDFPAWQQALTSDEYDYDQGGVFARYLIRTQGVDAFVRYYRQVPARRDPALFAANFLAFWNMSMDDAWAAMHTVGPGAAGSDAPICPCSLPMPATDGRPLDSNPAIQPYWPLPDAGGGSLGLTAPSGQDFIFADCEGAAPSFESNFSTLQTTAPDAAPLSDVAVAIVQPPSDGRRRYTITSISTASVGPYIADSCGGGVPYQLPPDFATGWGELSIMVDQTSIGAVTKYAQVQLPSIGAVDLGLGSGVDVCDSCGFDQGSCVATPGTDGPPFSVVPPGPVNVRWSVPPVLPGAAFPDPAGSWIQVNGMQIQ
jgi:hypothetical protein